ncbi:hypothetical protein NMG60_11036541 [Bertholletia excelsa]
MSKKKQVGRGGSMAQSYMDFKGQHLDVKTIMKDIEFLGSSHMTWKEKKELENRKVVALGGKPPKKQRLPLSVARVTMKKQKEREQKMLQEGLILGRFGGNFGGERKVPEKRKPEDKVLKSTQGHFRNGVLDVKHLLQPAAPKESDNSSSYAVKNKGKRKKGGKKQGKKGSGRKRG